MEHQVWLDQVNDTVSQSIQGLNLKEIQSLAEKIQNTGRIFLVGSGRTGLITQAFGMRLAQLGLPVYIIGQPTTPALEENDLLVLISGTGLTESLILAAKKAIEIGAVTHLVTQNPDSPLGRLIHDQLIIPSPPRDTKVLNGPLFELSLLITLDTVINQIVEQSGLSYDQMSQRHANIG